MQKSDDNTIPPAPIVFIRVQTVQPWPTGESVEIAGVLFQQDATDPFVLNAKIELPADDTDDALYGQARGRLQTALTILKRAMPGHAADPEAGATLDRGSALKHGIATLGASARMRQPIPLTDTAMQEIRNVAKTFNDAREASGKGRAGRLHAGAYWVEQSRAAPEASMRLLTAFFAIESLIGGTGAGTEALYHQVISDLGFPVNDTVKGRVHDLQDTRASLVHYGKLDLPLLQKHERWARDLAEVVVASRLGLRVPTSLLIASEP